MIKKSFESNYAKKLGSPKDNIAEWRKFFRKGIPDSHKGQVLIDFFEIDRELAE